MSGHIPDSFIEHLLSRVDIVDIISPHVKLKKVGINYVGLCPFHSEKTPSFSVSVNNVSKQFYHCFGCKATGDALTFLMQYQGLHFVEAVESLAHRFGLTVPTDNNDLQPAPISNDLYEILEKSASFYELQLKKHPLAAKAVHYLKSRGLTGRTAKQYRLGFAPPGWDHLIKHFGLSAEDKEKLVKVGLAISNESSRFYDRFRDRILFPIRDKRGRVVGFGGRIIESEQEKNDKQANPEKNDKYEPKYLNSPETIVFNKSRELYGLYEAFQAKRNLTSLIVVEGYIDVVSLANQEIPYVVATMGTALTGKHVEILFKTVKEITFCFDGDSAGIKASEKALHLCLPYMTEGYRVRFVILPDNEDPDSFITKFGKEAFLDRIEHANPLSDFLFKILSKGINFEQTEDRARFVSLAKPLLEQLPMGVYRQMMFEQLSKISGFALSKESSFKGSFKKDSPFHKEGKKSAKTGTYYMPGSGSSPPHMPHKRLPKFLPPALAHKAMAFLLFQRELFSKIEDLVGLDLKLSAIEESPGISLFRTLLKILQRDQDLSFQAILERLEQHSSEMALEFKNMNWQKLIEAVPSEGIELEFLGALQRLETEAQGSALDALLNRSKSSKLSSKEMDNIKQLIEEKNRD